MSNMRGINNPYSKIEKREFFIDVEKHRKEQQIQKNIAKLE
jgi:prephenate dehydratase